MQGRADALGSLELGLTPYLCFLDDLGLEVGESRREEEGNVLSHPLILFFMPWSPKGWMRNEGRPFLSCSLKDEGLLFVVGAHFLCSAYFVCHLISPSCPISQGWGHRDTQQLSELLARPGQTGT